MMKEKYSPGNGGAIPDQFFKPLKKPLFLKGQNSNANDSMKKDFEAVLQPKPKSPFAKT